jgi:hypothetical protein
MQWTKYLRELTAMPIDQLVASRHEKFRRMGVFDVCTTSDS